MVTAEWLAILKVSLVGLVNSYDGGAQCSPYGARSGSNESRSRSDSGGEPDTIMLGGSASR